MPRFPLRAGLLALSLTVSAASAQGPDLVANPLASDYDQFGYAVDVSGDVAIVGATGESIGTLEDGTPYRVGVAHVFRLSPDGVWALEATLRPVDFRPSVFSFGFSVAISGDVAVVSSSEYTNHTNPGSGDDDTFGVAYVFRRTAGEWVLERKLTPPAFSELAYNAVDVEGDRLVVGAGQRFAGPPGGGGSPRSASPPEPAAGPGGDGCIPYPVYENARADVYQFDGAAWVYADSLVEPVEILGTGFGISVSLSGDVIAVGAPLWYDVDVCTGGDTDSDGTTDGTERGRVYVYRAASPTDWRLDAELAPAGQRDRDQFGHGVAVSGGLLVAGAPYRDGVATRSGAAYAYAYDGAAWTEQQEFVGKNTVDGDYFGFAVDLEGEFAVVGAPYYRNGDLNLGATYGFRRVDGAWTQGLQVTYDEDTDPTIPFPGPLAFGTSVALSGAHVLIGAPDDNRFGGPIGDRVGSAFSYTLADYFDLTVAAEGAPEATGVALGAASPNPVGARSRVAFTLAAASDVRLVLIDALGREVATLAAGPHEAGAHTAALEAGELPAGVYVLRLSAGGRVETRRVTVAR